MKTAGLVVVPNDVVRTRSTVPVPAGLVAVNSLGDTTCMFVAAAVPNRRLLAPVKLLPTRVTVVPPVVLPVFGLTEMMVGPPLTSGVTALLDEEAGPVPTPFVAFTLKVYAVPFVNPVTVQLVAGAVAVHEPPGAPVTVYPVIAEPPVFVGAVQLTTA